VIADTVVGIVVVVDIGMDMAVDSVVVVDMPMLMLMVLMVDHSLFQRSRASSFARLQRLVSAMNFQHSDA